MMGSLIISIVSAALCCGCLGMFLWQGGEAMAGDTSWGEAAMPLVLSQLGILFFGVISMVTWKSYKNESSDSKVVLFMVLALFLEIALLLGVKTCVDINDRIVLLNEGVETRAVITKRMRNCTGNGRKSHPHYRFTTADGQKIEGSIQFQMKMSLPIGDNSRISLDSSDVTYRIGSTVPIRYMANDPERHVVLTFGELWLVPLSFAGMSLAFFGVTGYQIYYHCRRKRRRGRR